MMLIDFLQWCAELNAASIEPVTNEINEIRKDRCDSGEDSECAPRYKNMRRRRTLTNVNVKGCRLPRLGDEHANARSVSHQAP